MMVNDIVSIIGAVLMGISKATNLYYLLLAGRLIIGVSCGIVAKPGSEYFLEMTIFRNQQRRRAYIFDGNRTHETSRDARKCEHFGFHCGYLRLAGAWYAAVVWN